MTKATTEPGLCQVRSKTDRPCPRPAVVEISGVPFCERCAREQEAYFAIGELTQALAVNRSKPAQDLGRNEQLVEALGTVRRELAGYTVEEETERAKAAVGNPG